MPNLQTLLDLQSKANYPPDQLQEGQRSAIILGDGMAVTPSAKKKVGKSKLPTAEELKPRPLRNDHPFNKVAKKHGFKLSARTPDGTGEMHHKGGANLFIDHKTQQWQYSDATGRKVQGNNVGDLENQLSQKNVQARAFSDEKRKKLADSGAAMSDGSYPIVTRGDLENAVKAFGRSPDEATKQHIIKRAKALGATDALPDKWNMKAAGTIPGAYRGHETKKNKPVSPEARNTHAVISEMDAFSRSSPVAHKALDSDGKQHVVLVHPTTGSWQHIRPVKGKQTISSGKDANSLRSHLAKNFK